jgi:hypothetical protein
VKIENDQREGRERAIAHLSRLGGLSARDASALVDAALLGAVDHTLELINGAGPVPTTITTARADQLRFVCERAGRLVSQREVELLFRITPRAAQSALVTMLATYEEALRDKFLARFRADVVVIPSGTTDTVLTWTLRFTESTTLDAAWSELTRLGLLAESELNLAQKKIAVPRLVEVAPHHNGGSPATERHDVLDLLGLEKPEPT